MTVGYLFGTLVHTNRPDLVVRYAIPPVLSGTLALVFIGFARIPATGNAQLARLPGRLTQAIAGVCLGISAMLFLPSFAQRLQWQFSHHTQLAFPSAYSQGYRQYMDSSLSKQRKRVFAEAQRSTEANTRILAWAATPFHLDFSRNSIATMDTIGVSKIYKQWKDGLSNNEVNTFFCDRGIDHILIDYNGVGMRFTKRKDNFVRMRLVRFAETERSVSFIDRTHSIMMINLRGCNERTSRD